MEEKRNLTEDIINLAIEAAKRTDTINQRLLIALPVTVLIICITFIIILNIMLYYLYKGVQ